MYYRFPIDRESTAHHESGHAVMAFLSGIFVIDGPIDIDGIETKHLNAETPLYEDPTLLDRRQAEGWVIDEFERRKQRAFIAAAGFAAEKLYASKSCRTFDEAAAFMKAHGDVLFVQEIWGERAFLLFVERVTTAMQKPGVWEMVERLANALLTHSGPFPAADAANLLETAQADTGAEVALHLPDLRQPKI